MAENFLDVFTQQAITCFGHEGSSEHYKRLKETGALHGTQCGGCESITFPPRSFCPECRSDDVTWVPIGEGATLYAFTTQQRALRFTAPAVIGIVEVPNVGLMMAPIKGRLEDLTLGQPLTMEVVNLSEDLCVHQFVPA